MLYDPNWKKPLTQTQQIMLGAADLIEKHGHVKWDMGHPSRGFCLSGALHMTYGAEFHTYDEKNRGMELGSKTVDRGPVLEALLAISTRVGRPGIIGAIHWNNEPERTKEEVVGILREVAHAV